MFIPQSLKTTRYSDGINVSVRELKTRNFIEVTTQITYLIVFFTVLSSTYIGWCCRIFVRFSTDNFPFTILFSDVPAVFPFTLSEITVYLSYKSRILTMIFEMLIVNTAKQKVGEHEI